MVFFGFCKRWVAEKFTEPVLWKPRNLLNKSRYIFFIGPVEYLLNKIYLHKYEYIFIEKKIKHS